MTEETNIDRLLFFNQGDITKIKKHVTFKYFKMGYDQKFKWVSNFIQKVERKVISEVGRNGLKLKQVSIDEFPGNKIDALVSKLTVVNFEDENIPLCPESDMIELYNLLKSEGYSHPEGVFISGMCEKIQALYTYMKWKSNGDMDWERIHCNFAENKKKLIGEK